MYLSKTLISTQTTYIIWNVADVLVYYSFTNRGKKYSLSSSHVSHLARLLVHQEPSALGFSSSQTRFFCVNAHIKRCFISVINYTGAMSPRWCCRGIREVSPLSHGRSLGDWALDRGRLDAEALWRQSGFRKLTDRGWKTPLEMAGGH